MQIGNRNVIGAVHSVGAGAAEWDGMAQEQVGVSVGLEGIEWIEITTGTTAPEEQVGVSVGLTGITWEEVE